ncbi:hypothetical protein Tco_0727714 [Tanacetum coccineum]|uniref:Uncharacterized protein n=1 Tax=Tanacetum coccineum TaxID=301880 RepID=A0ABQ4YJ55_9ASTR
MSPPYVPNPKELERHAPVYVPEPVYPKYHALSYDDIPVEDQPLPVDTSPTALSSGYVADSNPEEDPEEDHADYPTNVGDGDNESFDDDDDDEEGEEASKDEDDDGEEEHLASADSSIVPDVDHVPLLRIQRHLRLMNMPLQKRACFTAPTPRSKVGESSTAAAARQPRSTVVRMIDYNFIDTLDASIRDTGRRAMAVDAQEDRAALRDKVGTLRRYLYSLCTNHEHDRVEARKALDRSEAHNRALEVRIAILETQVYHHEWQCQDADDHATGHIMCIQALEAEARIDTLEDTGSSA